MFDLSSLPVDALTGGAPNRHGNKGPLLLLVKGLNCCQDLMIQSSIQGRRYYELFVSSFFNFFLPNLFRILTLEQLVVTVEIKRFVLIYGSLQSDFFFHAAFCPSASDSLNAHFGNNAPVFCRCEKGTGRSVNDDEKL